MKAFIISTLLFGISINISYALKGLVCFKTGGVDHCVERSGDDFDCSKWGGHRTTDDETTEVVVIGPDGKEETVTISACRDDFKVFRRGDIIIVPTDDIHNIWTRAGFVDVGLMQMQALNLPVGDIRDGITNIKNSVTDFRKLYTNFIGYEDPIGHPDALRNLRKIPSMLHKMDKKMEKAVFTVNRTVNKINFFLDRGKPIKKEMINPIRAKIKTINNQVEKIQKEIAFIKIFPDEFKDTILTCDSLFIYFNDTSTNTRFFVYGMQRKDIQDCPTISGVLFEHPSCGVSPVNLFNIVLLDSNLEVITEVSPAITNNLGQFSFNPLEFKILDATELFSFGVLTSSIEFPGFKTIGDWINDSSIVFVLTPPALTITATNASCQGGNDGTATVTVTGGVSPYTYLWDDALAQTTAIATGLIADNYKVTVTDASNCSDTATADIIITDPVTEEWVQTYSGPDSIQNASMALDVNGDIYVVGQSMTFTSGVDIVTIKYDKAGVQQWVAAFNGTGNGFDIAVDIVVDKNSNAYVTGYSWNGSNDDYITIKYNAAGTQLWAVRYNGSASSDDQVSAIALDTSGNIYVTGKSRGTGNIYDYATVKYNNNGVQQWVTRYNGPANGGDEAIAIGTDKQGNVYVTGQSTGSGTSYDYATIKYNTNGVQQWVARYNGSGNSVDQAKDLILDNNANIYVTGGSFEIGTGNNFATIKYNTAGIMQWIQRYDGPGLSFNPDAATSIALDDADNVFVTGGSEGVASSTDYATVKYDNNGNFQWVARFDGGANSKDLPNDIETDKEGNAYVTGVAYTGPTLDYATIKYDKNGVEQWRQIFDGVNHGTNPHSDLDWANDLGIDGEGNVYVTGSSWNGNYFDYATVKYSQCNSIPVSGSSKTSYYDDKKNLAIVDEEQAAGNELTIHPNPYTGKTQINYNLQEPTKVVLEVYNVFGKRIMLITDQTQDEGYYTYQFSAGESGHQPGIYLVRLRLGDKMFTKRLVEFK